MATKKATEKESTRELAKFSKEQLLKSARFADRKDIVRVVVPDTESLTVEEVEERINTFMKGKVN